MDNRVDGRTSVYQAAMERYRHDPDLNLQVKQGASAIMREITKPAELSDMDQIDNLLLNKKPQSKSAGIRGLNINIRPSSIVVDDLANDLHSLMKQENYDKKVQKMALESSFLDAMTYGKSMNIISSDVDGILKNFKV